MSCMGQSATPRTMFRWVWAWVLTKAVLVITQSEPNSQHDGCPMVPSLLQAAGFSPSCVATALATCTSQNDNHFLPLIQVQETMSAVRTALQDSTTNEKRPRHCRDLLAAGDTGAGIRQVYPFLKHPDASVTVYCDQTVDGGGWTVFQRRRNLTEREDFYRTWVEYQLGFGHLEGEFWLGLDLLHELTSVTLQELRIDLKDYEGEQRWAKYGRFNIGSPDTHYRISVGRYTGDAGDCETGQNGFGFSTFDADHDNITGNCAALHRGAWWYTRCHCSNLNGYQYVGEHDSYADGINWNLWKGYHYSLRETTMMFRPAF